MLVSFDREFANLYRQAFLMGDHVLRVSLLVQRGYVCSNCGMELGEVPAGRPTECRSCERESQQQPVRQHGSARHE